MTTADDYDAVPYEDCPLAQTRPDYLGIIARLLGIDAAKPDNCRMLELGCAAGGNIIPLAYYWPDSTFVGIELSEKQAEMGNRLIKDLQLQNAEIIQADLLTLDNSIGTFDYVIAHGVYSWVPPEVQNHLLHLVAKVLAPNGIAYVSYNTYPGWHFRNAIRDMMLYHGRNNTSPENRSQLGIELLQKLATGLPDNNSLSEKWLKKEAEMLLGLSSSYLLHDYLEENNRPEYFYQFIEKASTHKLQFVAEADMYTMLASTLTQAAEEDLENLEDMVEYQQYLDFYYVRFFRQSLLCREDLEIEYDLEIENTKEFYFLAYLTCNEEIDLHSTNPQTFNHPNGESFDIENPLTKAALVILTNHYPNSLDYSDLLQAAQNLLRENESRYASDDPDNMLQELFNLYLSQGLELSQIKRDFRIDVGDKPRANRLAQTYIKHNRCCIGTMHHSNISLDEFDRCLLIFLDGNRNIQEIKELVTAKIKTDSALHNYFKQVSTEPDNLAEILDTKIRQAIYYYALNGFLENS